MPYFWKLNAFDETSTLSVKKYRIFPFARFTFIKKLRINSTSVIILSFAIGTGESTRAYDFSKLAEKHETLMQFISRKITFPILRVLIIIINFFIHLHASIKFRNYYYKSNRVSERLWTSAPVTG